MFRRPRLGKAGSPWVGTGRTIIMTEHAYAQNRRIEISLVLKDANVRKVIDDYMHSVDQAVPAP